MVDPEIEPYTIIQGLKNYNSLGAQGPVSLSFNIPSGIPWFATPDFRQKISNLDINYLIDPLDPSNPLSVTLQNQRRPYSSKLSTTAIRPTYVFNPRIRLDYPVSISANSWWANYEIQQNIDPTGPPLTNFHLQANTIPYSLTLKPAFYQHLWLGNIELADKIDSANFQFSADLNTNNLLEKKYLNRLSQLNDISIRTIRKLKGTMGFGYGQNVYALWDVADWAQTLIPGPGLRVRGLTNSKTCRPPGYYNSIYLLSSALDQNMSPQWADRYIRGFLTPLTNFSTDHPLYNKALILHNNWRDIRGNTGFIEAMGCNSQDLWKLFDFPGDLSFINQLSSSLELIAYINFNNFQENHIAKMTTWDRFYGTKLESALNNIAGILTHTSNLDIFNGRSVLSKYKSPRLHLKYDIAHLTNLLTWILTEPWRTMDIHIPIKDKISSFIYYRARNYYSNFNGWNNSAPLFLSEFDGSKPYFGRFGEISTMTLRMGWGPRPAIVRDITWNKNNEYRFLNSLQINVDPGLVRPGINRIWGSEAIGEGRLATNFIVVHGIPGKQQFLDFIVKGEGGEVTVYENYGYDHRFPQYCNSKDKSTETWLLNEYPVIHSPGDRVIAERIFNAFKPSFLIRTAPFFDNEKQCVKFNRIVHNIISESVLSDPTNSANWLHFHDVLVNMRIPQNMHDWRIYNYFSSHIAAEEWVNRIQYIFGIHVDSSTFEFDYIINNPGLSIPSTSRYYTLMINKLDASYNSQLDPFNPNFDSFLISTDMNDLQNNYKYLWWQAYFNYLNSLTPKSRLSLLMIHLTRNFP